MAPTSYASPIAGLPPQSALHTQRAVFTEAYALIPHGVMRDIVTSYLPNWSETRAWVIARRLNGTTVPAFADTYGWILALRGQPDAALPYLETAAKGMTDNPEVQFHLAEVYRALKRPDDAKAQYAKVLAMVPADDTRDFVKTARTQSGQN